ncbi:bifunctional phosphopantothenoylcysteine decarboxylase/phosphopantothenate synthase [Rubrivirga sp. S365]|uniref:bifunctional phosphopantothenoylcysteine decarboxylase/phosphopantothenate synthase n=1 Tax=Rubrivirga sp. S365 TaxID=3076080 RepID=UPI0028C7B196|nr:bifunctional phosphopantothenoylcysteine decarboxylase/phosphopantothenate synthase [Rubrivirga sp. S365]MDT7855497.1 bifunctional phosphopantothenoylcysteine decarboxylase/phosphopantothenate synthase [Rubrivirga sp. S365]
MPLEGKKIVLGITGSIAAYKAADLVRRLVKGGADVQPVMTAAAARFIPPLTVATLAGREVLGPLFPDAGAAQTAWTKHVELGLWADGVVVAPATAQTLAKLAGGFCDSMLTAVVLSARCPVLVAPAMDHDMWGHPATRRNVATLQADGVTVVHPAHGELASGLVGDGRLPEPEDLARRIGEWLAAPPGRGGEGSGMGRDEEGWAEGPKPGGSAHPSILHPPSLSGVRVLVTAGPTREAIDPVRFLSNSSTGTMGFAVAEAAARRGARVTLVAGPVTLATPPGVERVDVETADEMLAAALAVEADLVVAAAAVSDYAPAEPSDQKLKKGEGDLVLRLRRTPDVLAALGERRRDGQTLVGFALETHDGDAHARAKLERKRLDWIALNVQGEPGAGFGTGTNRLTLLGRGGQRVEIATAPKAEIAAALLDVVTREAAAHDVAPPA